jgi:hypothetical protein
MGMSPIERFKTYLNSFFTTAETFRPPSPAEGSEITEARLHMLNAGEGKTLEKLIQRVDGVWTPAETAVCNAIRQEVRLAKDRLVKVPINRPYTRAKREINSNIKEDGYEEEGRCLDFAVSNGIGRKSGAGR